jgi:phospholipid transport system substrate-binding protein
MRVGLVGSRCLLLLILGGIPAGADQADAPAAFIQQLGDTAIRILESNTEITGRKVAFERLFEKDFDLPAIGRFVLGRSWRTATVDQRRRFQDAFSQYVVAIYATRFSHYSGEQFRVLGSRMNDEATATVSSQIISASGAQPIRIGWQVAREGVAYKITDVSVESLSMAVTQRDEFSAVIEQDGGDIEGLIGLLERKATGG